MTKIKKERTDLSLDKLSVMLKNPPQNVYVSIYTKERIEVEPVGRPSDKVTLSQVVEMIKRLDSKVDAGFKQVNDRIDKIEQRLDRVEHRLDLVEQRLDYNGLKKLPR